MQIVRRIMHRQPSLRTLLLLGGAVLMILVGLLGMHTFTSNAFGHGSGSASSAITASVPIAHGEVSGTHSATSAECDGACYASAGDRQGHMDAATACMLALLVGLLLLAPPLLLHRFGSLPWSTPGSSRLTSTSVLPRPPSLTVLSISRT